MTSLCRLTKTTVLLAIFSFSTLVFADEPGSNQEAAFNEKKNRGTQFYNERKYEAAIPLFQAAYTLNPDPLLLYNLGQAHRKLNRNIEALNYFRFFLRASTDSDPRSARKPMPSSKSWRALLASPLPAPRLARAALRPKIRTAALFLIS